MTDALNQHTILRSKKPFDPIGTLIRHWLKIVVFGSAILILLSPIVYLGTKPYYQTSGKIRISPVTQAFMSRNEETSITSYYTGFVQTQADRIKSPKIIEMAIDSLPLHQKSIFIRDGISVHLAAKLVERRLEVTHLRGTHLIEITYSKNSPQGMAELINKLMEVYIDEYKKEEERKDQVRLSSLLKEKERVESEIKKQTEKLQKYYEDVNVNTFLSNNDQLIQFQTAYEKAYRERVEKENRLESIIQEGEALKGVSLDAYVDDLVEKNTLISELDIFAQKSLHELRNSRIGMVKDNPAWKQVDERIKEIQEYKEEQRKSLREKIGRLLAEKRETELKEKIIQAEAEYQAAKNIEEDILRKREDILTEKVKLSPKIFSMHQIENNIDQMRKQLNKTESRFNEIKLESNASGRIILESKAERPGSPAGTNRKKLLALIFLFSFGSITGVCAIFDLLDERIRSNKDVENVIGTSPHRPISDYLMAGSKKFLFSRVTLDDPSNKVSRSIYSLAIRLDKERREQNAQIAVFTGVDSRSGVTEILLNTAHAMSRFCQSVLIIEANLNHPTLGKFTGLGKRHKGLVDFLLGDAEFTDCIGNDKERKIDILPAGHLPSEDELVMLDRSRIPKLLETLKKRYKFILIDTSPVLVSDLTEFIIVQADVVPLVIQGDRSIFNHSYMAGQSLMKLEVPAIAAILNWGAPRYRTQIQKIVFKLIWPIQSRIKYLISHMLHYTPSQQKASPENLKKIRRKAKSPKQDIAVTNIHPMKRGRPAKYQIGIVLFIILTILFSIMITRFDGEAELSSENRVRKAISLPEKRSPVSKPVVGRPLFENQYAHASARTPVSRQTFSAAFKASSGRSNNPDIVERKRHAPSEAPKAKGDGLKKPVIHSDRGEPIGRPADNAIESVVGEIRQENWILEQDPRLYTIQLLGTVDREMLLQFVETHGLADKAAYFHRYHKGRDWYSLIFGLYPGWSKAMDALKDLPEDLTGASPWVLPIDKVQSMITMKGKTG